MGLFHVQEKEIKESTVYFDVEPGLFYEVDTGFVTVTKSITAPFAVELGDRLTLSCMFDINWLMHSGVKIGFHFATQFQIVNGGGYICTFLQTKKPQTTGKVEVLVKTDALVIYHFANRGTLVISPKVSPEIQNIFIEQ